MKPIELKPIEIGYGDSKYIFYPRMISVAEQEEVTNRFNDISDSFEKFQKEFEICREAVEAFSAKPCERLVKEKGEFKKEPVESLQTEFAERSATGERIIREVYQLYLVQMRPESRFI